MEREMIIWPTGNQSRESLTRLGQLALAHGGRQGLARWAAGRDGSAAHVHGERHDLWWEFSLEASFRWQAHLHHLRPEVYQQRLDRLTRALGLEGLLRRETASLTHTARALADLAVALLPQPELLLWEEPFYLLGQTDAARAANLVRQWNAEGMALIAVAGEPPHLADLTEAAARPLLPLAR